MAFHPDGSFNNSLLLDPHFREGAVNILKKRQVEIERIDAAVRSPDVLAEYEKNRLLIPLIEPVGRFQEGYLKIFGEGNHYGVRPDPSSGENTLLYDRGAKGQEIATILKDMPWVDGQSVRVNPNGSIEASFLPNFFLPKGQTITLKPTEANQLTTGINP